ncbi:MAG: glycogen synthase GlgA [Spongiibacteraceae bacterium]
MRILHAAAEYQGIAKTGGLADMVAALSTALNTLDCDIRVCVPAYAGAQELLLNPKTLGQFTQQGYLIGVIEGRLATDGPLLWLLDCAELYGRSGNPYRGADGVEFIDNAQRFGIFGAAVARLARGFPDLPRSRWRPDVVHLHDWHAALAAVWLAQQVVRPRIIYTIHNLQHQGVFDREQFDALQLRPEWWHPESLEFYGGFSFMKAGLIYSDAITTVSPTYAREIQTPAYGHYLDGLLRSRTQLLHGIVNGIDESVWNPADDILIPAHYNRQSVAAGKMKNKQALQRALGLPLAEVPLVIFIGRLADQKGADLILAAQREILEMPLQFVMLASGDTVLEKSCLAWASAQPSRVAVRLQVDEPLAHQLTAAADLQLMPSRFEPCGLNQMYAQRYGTIPVVRNTGGLADTVVDSNPTTLEAATATGVTFEHADVGGVLYGLRRALDLVAVDKIRAALRHNGMSRDFSWRASAQLYLDLYRAG